MTRFQLVLIASVLGISTASAQQIDCANAQTQNDMTACAQRDWQIADTALNDAYRAAQVAMKAIDANRVEVKRGAFTSLRAAERAWIVYRDATCLSESFKWQGGSGALMVIYACRARVTQVRTAELWDLSKQN